MNNLLKIPFAKCIWALIHVFKYIENDVKNHYNVRSDIYFKLFILGEAYFAPDQLEISIKAGLNLLI